MRTKLLSSLTKIFREVPPNFPSFTEASCLSNEKYSFQLAVFAESAAETDISISVDSTLGDNVNTYLVKNIPAGINGYDDSDSFRYDPDRKEFPDLLTPVNGRFTVPQGEYHSLWFEVFPQGLPGKHKISITLSFDGCKATENFTLNVINAELPEQELLYTNWFHNDCLCTWYGVEAFSPEYWRIAEAYIKNASEHGVNMLLTPVFTPPLDTAVGGERPTFQLVKVQKNHDVYSFDFSDFEKYISLCLRNGIKAFEISHFFTQWGAEHAPKIMATVDGEEKRIFGWETEATGEDYVRFLEAFATEFRRETEKLGITEACWVHVSDEPNINHLESYKKASLIIQRLFPDYNMLDALSDIDFYNTGLVKTPVPNEGEADVFKSRVDNFWTYHCCGQTHSFLPNRLFAHPAQRNRVIGVLLYKYEAQGFLQWGHNFWYSRYSVKHLDPYKVTDADGEFPSGDSFVVYPGEGGVPLNATRQLVFREGLQDLRALKLLEKLTTRDFVMGLLEEGLDIPLSFTAYPHEQYWLLDLRKRINEEINKRV